jgi:integrase/recombinase XerD
MLTIRDLLPRYLRHAEFEWRLASETLKKYTYVLRQVAHMLGTIPATGLRKEHILVIKAKMAARGAGPSHIKSFVNAVRSFLTFCRASGIQTLDPKHLRVPRIPRREVVFLSPAEVEQFVSAIPMAENVTWFAFRVLVEVLLGSGMRISEALSLKRSSIDMETGEARIIGKGKKPRIVFFTSRALRWVADLLNRRRDASEWLFVLGTGRRFGKSAASKSFRFVRVRAGLKKLVTAHTLRHTVATTLLLNGCPIAHIKEVLGHSYLQTTCMYYLGTDKHAAKAAHLQYLRYAKPSEMPDNLHVA